MKLWQDRQWRVNILFGMPFIFLALVALGLNIYKNVRYASFDLSFQTHPALTYQPLSGQSHAVNPVVSTAAKTSFDGLQTSWWLHQSPAYSFRIVWFKASPTLRGNLKLTNAVEGTNLNAPTIFLKTLSGTTVKNDVLKPGIWYQIGQEPNWSTVMFNWK